MSINFKQYENIKNAGFMTQLMQISICCIQCTMRIGKNVLVYSIFKPVREKIKENL